VRKFLPYLRYLKPVWGLFVLALLAGVVYGVASGFTLPFVIQKVLPILFPEAGDGGVPAFVANPPEVLGVQLTRDSILLLTVMGIPLVFLVRALSGFINVYWSNYCGGRVLEQVRSEAFAKLQRLHLGFFQKNNTGDLLSRIINDTQQLQNSLTQAANDLVKQPITLIGALGYLAWESMRQEEVFYMLLTMLIIPVCVLPIRYAGKKMLKRAYEMQTQAGDLSHIVSENIGAPREVRAYGLEPAQQARFDRSASRFLAFFMKTVKYGNIISPSVEVIAAFGLAVAIYFAAQNGVTLGQITAMAVALYMSYDPVKKLGAMHTTIQRGRASIDRLEYILRQEEIVRDPENPLPLPDVRGAVSFKNVSFAYDEAPVLEEVNLEIPAGQTLAIVGPSGAGKSTFINLIPRFYDPVEGSILLDGTPVDKLRLGDLRKQIAIVSQEPVLFNATVRENILIGNPGATDAQIQAAARDAQAADFIEAMEEGYGTMLGERGTRLSGGQRQRIAIARAFLKDAPVLILDEATSALDSQSEDLVQRALEKLVKGRTVFLIAHRFSTLSNADRILVLEKGRMTGLGTHEELYNKNETYCTLYDRQANLQG